MASCGSLAICRDRYIAAMVLAGAGDSLGYRLGEWEFNRNGQEIHSDVKKLGGISRLLNKVPLFRVSDDTVMHLATARALVAESGKSELDHFFDKCAHEYIQCMSDMSGRAPGFTCLSSCEYVKKLRNEKPDAKLYRIPFNKRGGGCGGSMRAMCIGLRYPHTSDLDQLIAVSVECGRMTHNHPTGYLGSLVSALFTSYAIQTKPIISWGAELVKDVLPLAKKYIENVGIDVEANISAWSYFEDHWKEYLALRQISNGGSEPVFPDPFDVPERDAFYSAISHNGWGGASGHDSTIIAYDALLGCKGNWEELCNRGVFHGGDSDSTGTICCCWFGAFYGLIGVYDCNHEEMEYRDEMVKLADKLFTLSHPSQP